MVKPSTHPFARCTECANVGKPLTKDPCRSCKTKTVDTDSPLWFTTTAESAAPAVVPEPVGIAEDGAKLYGTHSDAIEAAKATGGTVVRRNLWAVVS